MIMTNFGEQHLDCRWSLDWITGGYLFVFTLHSGLKYEKLQLFFHFQPTMHLPPTHFSSSQFSQINAVSLPQQSIHLAPAPVEAHQSLL